jgi:ABC-2 type transport system permease protein
VVLAAFFYESRHLPDLVRLAATNPRAAQGLNLPYAAAAAATFLISALVAVFYSLGALHGERRDRSLLFWKSLPVSDLTTVLSKAAVPVLVQPVVALVVAFATQLIMLAWSSVVLLANGVSPGLLFDHLQLSLLWLMVPYGLAVNAAWDLPLYGWLLLVSAWAKRMTFVWAVAPWLAAALFEFLAFRTQHLAHLAQGRLFGGFNQAFTHGGHGGHGKAAITSLSQVDPVRVLANPGLWTGLVFGVACLAACVWLRRRQEPI